MEHRHILFDFDGVLAQTNEIRFWGFVELFGDISTQEKAQFMTFVRANGGLSRYGKIRHLYERILCRPISDDDVNVLAAEYSQLVAQKIIEAEPVAGSLEFLEEFRDRFDLAIVSGSDQDELRAVCRARGIDHYFQAILGSPKEKRENIVGLLSSHQWEAETCVYVGDSSNDCDAAAEAGVDFIGRDSGLTCWKDTDEVWISDLRDLPAAIDELSERKKSKGGNP